MQGSSQGNCCPGNAPTSSVRASPNRDLTCGNARCAQRCVHHTPSRRPLRSPRPRVAFSDSTRVRHRLEAQGRELGLRGARQHVLAAALDILCGWSRIADDQLRLSQLVELTVKAGGPRHDLKTVGRALASLTADELLVYVPAQGRGRHAYLAIHPRFTSDIVVLTRDTQQRVIVAEPVTFSRPRPYINQITYPPTPRSETRPVDNRPVGVEVSAFDLREVLRELPEPLARLPKHLKWMLGREIRLRLHAGWRPEQILDVLSAPTPDDLQRPWRLALWRLRHNIIGAGPRLRPLQQAWDSHERLETATAARRDTARWYDDVVAAADAELRSDLLRADESKFGRRSADPVAALACAGRRAAQLFPDMPLMSALKRWVRETLSSRPKPVVHEPDVAGRPDHTTSADALIAGFGGCVVCGSREATAREQLPLKSELCEQCWPMIAADLIDETDSAVGAA